MKKIFALGVMGLLMLGAASQADAAFEAGNFTMAIYDTGKQQEIGFDLGAFAVTQSDTSVITIPNLLNADPGFLTAKTVIGIWSDLSNSSKNEGYFVTTKSTGMDLNRNISGFVNADNFDTKTSLIQSNYNSNGGSDGVSNFIGTGDANSFKTSMGTNYSGVKDTATMAKLPAAGATTTMYLYHFTTDTVNQLDPDGNPITGKAMVQSAPVAGYNYITDKTYEGVFTLNNNTLAYTTNLAPVPVPGAAWLLGSGLLALVGIRRRKNS